MTNSAEDFAALKGGDVRRRYIATMLALWNRADENNRVSIPRPIVHSLKEQRRYYRRMRDIARKTGLRA